MVIFIYKMIQFKEPTTSIISTGTNVSIFATTTNLKNLSSNSTLSINN